MRLIVDIQKELKSHTLQIQFETKTQTTGILGASGCGKSMLLKCIAGVETADKGQIVLNDQVLFDAEKKNQFVAATTKNWSVVSTVCVVSSFIGSRKSHVRDKRFTIGHSIACVFSLN